MTDLTISQTQAALSALIVIMMAKGLTKPIATITLTADSRPAICTGWEDKTKPYNRDSKACFGDGLDKLMADMKAWAEALPSIEERKFTEFQRALANAVEIGRENGVDVEFVNPLSALVLKLSENALMAPKEST